MGFVQLTGYSLLVVLVGFFQQWPLLAVHGIRANFVMVLLIALSFLPDKFYEYLWFIVLGLFFLKFQSGFDGALLGTGLIAIAAFWLGREMPWNWIFNNTVLIVVGTLATYILAKPSFIIGSWLVVLGEIIYNVIIGTLLFFAFSSDERRSKF
ncbi:MAG: hypothetical protein G01um10143_804 [Parcubacteria group bacterium Gr01-1014_3]|nr:MAG: hypothetical protein G01um10143_804 [Parcubacteria group bacterium Gr01-1014_3]